MQDIINAKLDEWQHNLAHLEQERAALRQRLADVEANIMRHQGAVLACEELLKAAEPAEVAAAEPAEVAPAEPAEVAPAEAA